MTAPPPTNEKTESRYRERAVVRDRDRTRGRRVLPFPVRIHTHPSGDPGHSYISPAYMMHAQCTKPRSVVEHGGYPAAAKARSEAQALGAHGEVGYKVPDQSDELDDRRYERE
jgi:hypothetical protein